jgi:hypothetical protein
VIGSHEAPEKLTLDGSHASHQAVAELKAECVLPDQTLIQTNKRLNNLMVKQRCYPTPGFKTFGNAQVTRLLTFVGMLACRIPARRAAKVDPIAPPRR